MKIGTFELILILIVALIALGPEKMPIYAKKVGKTINLLKSYTQEFTNEINENIVEPIENAKKPIKDIIDPIETVSTTINEPMKAINKSIRDIGKISNSTGSEIKTE